MILGHTAFLCLTMDTRLRRYKKGSEYSYSFGVYPTLELLHHRPQDVLGVIVHPKGEKNEGVDKIRTICQDKRISMEINARLPNRLGARENDYAMGIFQVTETRLDPGKNHVVLVNPGGRGNLGTIIRTMLGFNFQDLAIIKPAADIFHPDVIRASMGALFQLRFGLFTDYSTYEKTYPRNMYPLMTDGKITLPDAVFKLPYSLIFGNESSGLSEEFHQIGTSVSIPQSRRIDSLNLAASVSVTLYQANLKNER